MSSRNTSIPGLTLSNVPVTNLRWDFNRLLGQFRNEAFRNQFRGHQGVADEIRTHHFTWYGRPEVLLTHLLREAIVSLESAVSTAVKMEAQTRGLPLERYAEAVEDPLTLGGGTAESVYNRLPTILDPTHALRETDADLWERTRVFYKEVRNGLFHTYELASAEPEPIWQSLELLGEVHQWLNQWHPISRFAEGPIDWAPGAVDLMGRPAEISDLEVLRRSPQRGLPDKWRVRPEQAPDDVVVEVEDVTGVYIPPSELVDLGIACADGRRGKINMSVRAAMRLLAFLALAQKARGWALPDRL